MILHLAIRGYAAGGIQFEQRLDVDMQEMADVIGDLGEKHAVAMVEGTLDMIEIEFLDEPDENQRFYRIGTDPTRMVRPFEIKF